MKKIGLHIKPELNEEITALNFVVKLEQTARKHLGEKVTSGTLQIVKLEMDNFLIKAYNLKILDQKYYCKVYILKKMSCESPPDMFGSSFAISFYDEKDFQTNTLYYLATTQQFQFIS